MSTCPHCGTEVHIHHPTQTYACQTPTCRAFHGEGMERLPIFEEPSDVRLVKDALGRPKAEGGLSFDQPGSRLTSEALDVALACVNRIEVPPTLVLSPAAHAEACRLLGKPEGSALTTAEVYKAASKALEDL